MTLGPKRLFAALDIFHPSDIKKADLLIGLAFGVGGIWMGISAPDELRGMLPMASGLVGVVIGAVVAGAAILGAFLDQAFLKKLKRIDADPVNYFAPLFFTGFLGVVASLLMLVLRGLPVNTPTWLFAAVGGLTALSVGWTIASLIFDLDALVGFLRLQEAALDVKEDPNDEGKPPLQEVRS